MGDPDPVMESTNRRGNALVILVCAVAPGCFVGIDLDRLDGGDFIPMNDADFPPGFDSGAPPLCPPGASNCMPGMCPPDMVEVQSGSIAFCIDSAPVTNGAYQTFLDGDGTGQPTECNWNGDFSPAIPLGSSGASVVGINWCDAYTYCISVRKHLCGRIGGGAVSTQDVTTSGVGAWETACTQSAITPSSTIEEWQDACARNGQGRDFGNDSCVALGGSGGCTNSVTAARRSSASSIGFRCCN
jgi:hypothetical protein